MNPSRFDSTPIFFFIIIIVQDQSTKYKVEYKNKNKLGLWHCPYLRIFTSELTWRDTSFFSQNKHRQYKNVGKNIGFTGGLICQDKNNIILETLNAPSGVRLVILLFCNCTTNRAQ